MLSLIQTAVTYLVPWLAVLTLVVTVHELGHFLTAKALGVKIDCFSIGFGPAIARWTDRSGVEWRLSWIPLGGYVRFAGDENVSSSAPNAEELAEMRRKIVAREGIGAEKKYFQFKAVWRKALIVFAGPFANFVLSTALFAALLLWVGSVSITPRIGAVAPGSAADQAGFMPGDLITSANGRPVKNFESLVIYVALRAGEPIRFDVTRAGRPLKIVATPQRKLRNDPVAGRSDLGVLGVSSSPAPGDISRLRYNPVQALAGGAARTWNVIDTTLFYLWRVVTGRESGDQLGGPLRTLKVSGAAAVAGAENGTTPLGRVEGVVFALANVAAVFSVGIGFVNLLPVPVLDGGHLVFYAYEAVARRPLAARVQAAGYRVGLALLVGLMLFATWNDLQQLRVFKFLGGVAS